MRRKNVLTGVFILLIMLLWHPMAYAAVVDPPEEVYVGDYANVLTDETEQYIIEKNQELNQATGAQIVIVTVDFLDGMPIEEYAYTIFNQWGIGDANKNNGLLLLLAIGEDDYWVMQGKGLEGVLSSGTLGDYLAEYLEPDFAVGEYDAGVNKVFHAFYDWFTDYYHLDITAAVDNRTPNHGSQPIVILFVCIILFLFIGFIGQNNRNRKNNQYRTARNSGTPYYRDYRNNGMPPASGGGVYTPPRKPVTPKKQKTNAGSWFGGGSSSGGGTGRNSKGTKNSYKSSNASFGKGASRGGGAGRSSGGFGAVPKSNAGSRGTGSNCFGGGASRGGGAGRSSGGSSGAGRRSGGNAGGGSARGGGAGRR